MKRITSLVLLLSTCTSLLHAQSVLAGRVVGANGEPMALAHVELYPFMGRWQVMQNVEVAPDGTFSLTAPKNGFYTVTFSGAMHRLHRSPFYFDGDTVEVEVQLARQWLDPDQSFTRVVGNFNDFDYDSGIQLEEVEPGVFEATVKATEETLIYELPGSPSANTYADVQLGHMAASGFLYKRLGEYLAVLPVEDGKATVRYDAIYDSTQTLPSEAEVVFIDAESDAARFHAIYPELVQRGNRSIQQRVRIGQSREENPVEMQLEAQVAADDVAFVIEREPHAFQRMLHQLRYLNEGGGGLSLYWRNRNASSFFALSGRYTPDLDQPILHQIVADVAPSSLFWGLQPYWLDVLAEQLDGKSIAYAYIDSVIAQHPDRNVQATVMFNRFDSEFAKHGMTETASNLLNRLQTTFADVDFAEDLDAFVNMDPQTVVGQAAQFGFARDLATGERLREDAFLGHVTLVDFWTTECAACVSNMDSLRTLQTTYSDQKFAIWSVGLEASPLRADQFARRHDLYDFTAVHGGGGFRSPIAAALKAYRAPYRVLIDEKGEVLHVGDVLFGDSLDSILRTHFETDSAGGVR